MRSLTRLIKGPRTPERRVPANGSISSPPDPALLCISQSFSPDTTPTAIRASKLLEKLSAQWNITVLTETQGAQRAEKTRHVEVEVVPRRQPKRLLAALRRARLEKLLALLIWPDEAIFWVLPAILAGRRRIKESAPSAIVVFMMPYSSGLAGIALSRLSGLPLVLNLDDSPTCTDMHPWFPTRLHHRLARALEEYYVKRADAVIYVSQMNLEIAGTRLSDANREKLHLVRYGADPADFHSQPPLTPDFEIAYVGAMSGWWALIEQGTPTTRLRRIYAAWNRLGRYEVTALDPRTSSPAFVGQAILDMLAAQPDWDGRVGMAVHGNPYPASVVARALESSGVERVVRVFDPVAHGEIADILSRADVLFLTLPKRLDGSRGGRISAKTYEYLMTDRPILAAVPLGENWDYLADKPGVWLVEPDNTQRMQEILTELVRAKFNGAPQVFDRRALREEISYESRAGEFAGVIRSVIDAGSAPER